MSVQLVSTPDPVALTKGGRMVYEFLGSGRLQTTGVKAVGTLFLAYAVPDGTKLTVRWNGVSRTLKFVSDPREPGEFLSGDGTANHVNLLLAQFKAYFPFRQNFTLTRTDPSQLAGIVFTAKKPGKAYGLDVDVSNVGTPFGFGTIEGADPLVRTQYSIYCELMLQKVGTDGSDLEAHYEPIFSPTIECDADGKARFDVGDTLHAHLLADWPDWNLNRPVRARQSARKYFIWYAESYGSPMIVARLSQDLIRQAYLGGGDYLSKAGGGLAFQNGLTTPDKDPALRYGPLTRYVRPDEPQYLSFVNARGPQPVKLKITKTYDNGSTGSAEVAVTDPYATGDKLLFSSGPAQLNLLQTTPAGRTLSEYSVQLVSTAGTALSASYRYVLNYDFQPYTRYFIFLNSLGAPDTLTTFGKGSSELTRFFEQAERYLPSLYEVKDGQFVEYDVATQQQLEVTTGFRSEAELRGWTDFYRSRERFHWVNAEPLPVGLTSKTIKQAKDGDTLFAHSFSFVYLFRDDFYVASEPILSDVLPPAGFMPAGTVSVQPAEIVYARDNTVPDAVRNLSPARIAAWDEAAARPNPQTQGYLDQTAGNKLYRTKEAQVPYADISGKPTTRDAAGLSDVPTKKEVAEGTSAGLRRKAPDVDDSVVEASGLTVLQTIQVDGVDYQVSRPMNFSVAAGFIFQNASEEQITWLLGKLKPTLDQILTNGNESSKEEIIKASQRRTLQLEDTLSVISGRIYDPARKLYVERETTISGLAASLLKTPEFRAALATGGGTNPNPGTTAPAAGDWRFGDIVTCEDQFKELGDDLSNKDFQ